MNVNIPSQKNTTTLPLHVFLPADIRLAQDISSRLTIWDIPIFLITSSWTLLWILRSYHRPGKNPYHDFFYSVPQANVRLQNSDMVIFWGSETGTAERFAHRLANELEQRFDMRILVADLDDFDHRHLVTFPQDKVAGFILSTYGEGDPPGTRMPSFGR